MNHAGFHDKSSVRELLKECSRMYSLDHPNVVTLCGVCLDGGTAPYIIMPFMSNGSLLTYLKNNRSTLVISQTNNSDYDEEEVSVKPSLIACIYILHYITILCIPC